MRCALVDSKGEVVNIIVADPVHDKAPSTFAIIAAPDDVAIGAKWDGLRFNRKIVFSPGGLEML